MREGRLRVGLRKTNRISHLALARPPPQPAAAVVTQQWRIKISDFNLSKLIANTPSKSSIHALNPRWLAPEVLEGGRATLLSVRPGPVLRGGGGPVFAGHAMAAVQVQVTRGLQRCIRAQPVAAGSSWLF